jgi:hypothetical protein
VGVVNFLRSRSPRAHAENPRARFGWLVSGTLMIPTRRSFSVLAKTDDEA